MTNSEQPRNPNGTSSGGRWVERRHSDYDGEDLSSQGRVFICDVKHGAVIEVHDAYLIRIDPDQFDDEQFRTSDEYAHFILSMYGEKLSSSTQFSSYGVVYDIDTEWYTVADRSLVMIQDKEIGELDEERFWNDLDYMRWVAGRHGRSMG